MSKRKRGLTPEEIQKLLDELEDETFDDSDSDCELEKDDEQDLDLSIVTNPNDTPDVPVLEETEEIIWENPDLSQKAVILPFLGVNTLKGSATFAVNESDFFECIFSNSVITKLTDETNKYAKRMIPSTTSTPSVPKKHYSEWKETNESEIKKFLALTLLMGHIDKDSIKEYWSTDQMLETPYFRTVMSRDRFIILLRYLHFEDNASPPDKNAPDYDRLWKIRFIFDELNRSFKEIYEPSEELAVDEVIVSFKGRVIFRQYIPKKRKRFGIKVYKLVDKKGYTFNMRVYLGKDKKERQEKSSAHTTVVELVECVKGKGHKLFMDNFFSSPSLFVELYETYKMNSCGTMRKNRKHYPKKLVTQKMKKGDLSVMFGKSMTAMCWKDKREVFMLSNMHNPDINVTTVHGDICEKPHLVESYNTHDMGYVDLSIRMANSYTFGRKTLKWTKKLFFHLLDLAVLNAYILYETKTGNHISHKVFRQNLILQLVKSNQSTSSPSPQQCVRFSRVRGSESNHWPEQKKVQRRCVVCKSKGVTRRTSVSCKSCNVGLCINCFEEYHTK